MIRLNSNTKGASSFDRLFTRRGHERSALTIHDLEALYDLTVLDPRTKEIRIFGPKEHTLFFSGSLSLNAEMVVKNGSSGEGFLQTIYPPQSILYSLIRAADDLMFVTPWQVLAMQALPLLDGFFEKYFINEVGQSGVLSVEPYFLPKKQFHTLKFEYGQVISSANINLDLYKFNRMYTRMFDEEFYVFLKPKFRFPLADEENMGFIKKYVLHPSDVDRRDSLVMEAPLSEFPKNDASWAEIIKNRLAENSALYDWSDAISSRSSQGIAANLASVRVSSTLGKSAIALTEWTLKHEAATIVWINWRLGFIQRLDDSMFPPTGEDIWHSPMPYLGVGSFFRRLKDLYEFGFNGHDSPLNPPHTVSEHIESIAAGMKNFLL